MQELEYGGRVARRGRGLARAGGAARRARRRRPQGAKHHEKYELQLRVRGPMYSNEHSKHVQNIQENIYLLLILVLNRSRTPHRRSRLVRRCFRLHPRPRRERLLVRATVLRVPLPS
jgi:hypothetical protein